MNIDNMTYGELKEIAKLFNNNHDKQISNPIIGKFCIARCYSAGVHAGFVESVDGENIVLTDSYRLWYWKAADGIALSGLAQHGLSDSGSKIDTKNPVIYLTGVCELIPCSEKSYKSFSK